MAKLHWNKVAADRWETEEQVGGSPDFVIDRIPRVTTDPYRMKFRSARRAYWFATLAEAKNYAETAFGPVAR